MDSGSTNDETGSDSNGINENGTDGNGDDGVVNITNGDDVKADDGANAFVVFTATMLVMTFTLTQ